MILPVFLRVAVSAPAARVSPEPRERVLRVRPPLHENPSLLVEQEHREGPVQQQPLAGQVRLHLSRPKGGTETRTAPVRTSVNIGLKTKH